MTQDMSNDASYGPLYNIKAAARMVGLLPVTLRAWERRYGIPSPQRTGQGYRLYTEQDLRVLRWLKEKVETGLSIGRAVDYLAELQRSGQGPVLETRSGPLEPYSPERLSQGISSAFARYDDTLASGLLSQAFSLYSPDVVLLDVIKPALTQIGEAWHRGEIPVATEHFATAFCIQHLLAMSSAALAPWRQGMLIAACLPGETHEIGLLMIAVLLRWRGWNVKYLGQDLSLERLDEVLQTLKPQMLLFSATRPENLRALGPLKTLLGHLRYPPQVIFGGQAFDSADSATLPGVLLRGKPEDDLEEIEKRLQLSRA